MTAPAVCRSTTSRSVCLGTIAAGLAPSASAAKGFPARRVGRLLRFGLSEVDEWVKAGGDDSESSPASNTAKGKTQRHGSDVGSRH